MADQLKLHGKAHHRLVSQMKLMIIILNFSFKVLVNCFVTVFLFVTQSDNEWIFIETLPETSSFIIQTFFIPIVLRVFPLLVSSNKINPCIKTKIYMNQKSRNFVSVFQQNNKMERFDSYIEAEKSQKIRPLFTSSSTESINVRD